MIVKKRRYYFANVIAGVIHTLGIPEYVKPAKEPAASCKPEYIAWMAIKVARLNVYDFNDAREAQLWVERIIKAMEQCGLWMCGRGKKLYELDRAQHFHLPMSHA